MQIILVNGPPGSGKDAVAQIIQITFLERIIVAKFAEPLRVAAKNIFGFESDEELEKAKRSNPRIREFMIGYSENFIKPFFGRNFFGLRAAQFVNQYPNDATFIFTDCGFEYELHAFIDSLEKDPKTIELWRIYRPGYDFDGDSRSYVSSNGRIVERDLENSGGLEELEDSVVDMFFLGRNSK
jgi:hypothetical protein